MREGSVFTSYIGRFAYDEANLRFRFLEGIEDEREPAYAHYFFYKEVSYTLVIEPYSADKEKLLGGRCIY